MVIPDAFFLSHAVLIGPHALSVYVGLVYHDDHPEEFFSPAKLSGEVAVGLRETMSAIRKLRDMGLVDGYKPVHLTDSQLLEKVNDYFECM